MDNEKRELNESERVEENENEPQGVLKYFQSKFGIDGETSSEE